MKIREYLNDVKLNLEERDYLTKKIQKIQKGILSNFEDSQIFVDLKVNQNKKKEWSLEVIFNIPRNIFKASQKGFDLREAMDQVEEVLTRQILRKKEKIQDLRERGNRSLRKKRSIDEKARF
jgi:ribosomal subunit interface protein